MRTGAARGKVLGLLALAVLVAALALVLLRPEEGREEKPRPQPSDSARARPGDGIAWGEEADGLRIGLSASRRSFARGEWVELVVQARNTGDRPIRLLLARYPSRWSFRCARADGGAVYEIRGVDPPDTLMEPDITLDPGEEEAVHCSFISVDEKSVGRTSGGDLTRAFPTGWYTVTAGYSQKGDAHNWRGSVTTGAVEIEILPREAEEGAR